MTRDEAITAAWRAFKGARNGPIGPGPGFVEALAAIEPYIQARIAEAVEAALKACEWQPIETAPKDKPFSVATGNGGVLLEAWHWCSNTGALAGIYSGATLAELRKEAPGVLFFWRELPRPPDPSPIEGRE